MNFHTFQRYYTFEERNAKNLARNPSSRDSRANFRESKYFHDLASYFYRFHGP